MRKLRIVIADDDPEIRELLRNYISNFPNMVVVHEVNDGEQLYKTTVKWHQKIDILLVDINMPKINGMEVIRLTKKICPHIKSIFITGYGEFAVEAFNLAAVDFLMKPINQERLYEALVKTVHLIRLENDHKNAIFPSNNRLVIKRGRSVFYIPVHSIYFIEKAGKLTLIHSKSGLFETGDSLDSLESTISNRTFFRSHRSYIVNTDHILQVETFGKTYLAYFDNYDKIAHISKLKIKELETILNPI
ncbi:LytR/AlgR family response regulator transcription factor [Evansella tamaricis]|uniref:LytTR family DNA-binding domain-containing protein n=1 Tax=Evansella tamaricis TaxID=2069301 RepID=A0ABS6J952_9BACI|nr:LytTR family DNA-binding domain-containing protein [Evansella tamaricis]MBU9710207.1 LytTR family DNA-binding domain-containing protein [Evansella tamaricis]